MMMKAVAAEEEAATAVKNRNDAQYNQQKGSHIKDLQNAQVWIMS